MFIFERERQSMSRGETERERERETESETGSRLWAVSTEPDAGLEPTTHEIMTWAEVGRSIDWATQVPLNVYFWERETMLGWDRKRGWQRIQSRLCTDSREPDVGLRLINWEITTWAKVRCSQPTELPRQPPHQTATLELNPIISLGGWLVILLPHLHQTLQASLFF